MVCGTLALEALELKLGHEGIGSVMQEDRRPETLWPLPLAVSPAVLPVAADEPLREADAAPRIAAAAAAPPAARAPPPPGATGIGVRSAAAVDGRDDVEPTVRMRLGAAGRPPVGHSSSLSSSSSAACVRAAGVEEDSSDDRSACGVPADSRRAAPLRSARTEAVAPEAADDRLLLPARADEAEEEA